MSSNLYVISIHSELYFYRFSYFFVFIRFCWGKNWRIYFFLDGGNSKNNHSKLWWVEYFSRWRVAIKKWHSSVVHFFAMTKGMDHFIWSQSNANRYYYNIELLYINYYIIIIFASRVTFHQVVSVSVMSFEWKIIIINYSNSISEIDL